MTVITRKPKSAFLHRMFPIILEGDSVHAALDELMGDEKSKLNALTFGTNYRKDGAGKSPKGWLRTAARSRRQRKGCNAKVRGNYIKPHFGLCHGPTVAPRNDSPKGSQKE